MPGTPVVDRVLEPQGDVVAEDDVTEESDEILAGLSEAERRLLPGFAGGRWPAPRPELLDMNVSEYLVAITHLELKGLLEKSLSGYRITRRGQIALKGQPD